MSDCLHRHTEYPDKGNCGSFIRSLHYSFTLNRFRKDVSSGPYLTPRVERRRDHTRSLTKNLTCDLGKPFGRIYEKESWFKSHNTLLLESITEKVHGYDNNKIQCPIGVEETEIVGRFGPIQR